MKYSAHSKSEMNIGWVHPQTRPSLDYPANLCPVPFLVQNHSSDPGKQKHLSVHPQKRLSMNYPANLAMTTPAATIPCRRRSPSKRLRSLLGDSYLSFREEYVQVKIFLPWQSVKWNHCLFHLESIAYPSTFFQLHSSNLLCIFNPCQKTVNVKAIIHLHTFLN